jgi:hypothetical protein
MVILLPHPSRRASSGQAVAPVGRHLPPAPGGVPLRFRGRLKEGPARSSLWKRDLRVCPHVYRRSGGHVGNVTMFILKGPEKTQGMK